MADIIEKDDDIIIVEQEPKTQETPPAEEEPKKPVVVNHDDDDDDDDDERIQQSTDDEDREAIRERRRKEKQDRKERREQAIKRDKLEMDFLRKRNDDLERRLTAQEQRSHNGDIAAIDNAIGQASRDMDMASKVLARAIEAGNGEDAAQALRFRDEAAEKIQQLKLKKQQSVPPAQQPQQPQSPSIDDKTLQYAQAFTRDNPWYDVQGRDEDSAIVMAIDQSLSREGFDPRSEEYWNELRKRTARRLPERFQTEQPREPRRGPAVGSGKEHAPASTKKEVYISPERKQALIEAGVWDDPVLRMKYVKRYAEYDKQHKQQ